MACCGDDPLPVIEPVGKQSGDVLAIATWMGNRHQRGLASGRLYPRAGNGARMWVDPRDIAVRPNLWREVSETPDIPQPEPRHIPEPQPEPTQHIPHGVDEIAAALWPHIYGPNAQPPMTSAQMQQLEPVGRGDVDAVLRLAHV